MLQEFDKLAFPAMFEKAEEAALRRVAELAVEEKTGARALVTILEKAQLPFLDGVSPFLGSRNEDCFYCFAVYIGVPYLWKRHETTMF